MNQEKNMEIKTAKEFLRSIDLKLYKHASNYKTKINGFSSLTRDKQNALGKMFEEYYMYIQKNISLNGYSKEVIFERVSLLNNYYNFINQNNFDNVFSSQGKFRSTILEEFMYILFRDLIVEKLSAIEDVNKKIKIGGQRAYTNLYFSGSNFLNFVENPEIGIHQKDQDFAIYRPVKITVENNLPLNANLPVVAIENKTYIDKTMLDGSISTAEKIKAGNPYCLFLIVCENYDVSLTIDPKYSKIDQIYVLRKAKRNAPNYNQPIFPEIVVDLFDEVNNHLSRDWSNVENKLLTSGKII